MFKGFYLYSISLEDFSTWTGGMVPMGGIIRFGVFFRKTSRVVYDGVIRNVVGCPILLLIDDFRHVVMEDVIWHLF